MNASNRWFVLLVTCSLLTTSYATQLVQGNVTPAQSTTSNPVCPTPITTTFTQSIQTTTYDRGNGIFYVGLAGGAGDYAISSFARPVGGQQIPCFKARTPNTDTVMNPLNDQSIQGLAIAEGDGDTCSLVAGYETSATNVFVLNQLNNVGQSNTLFGYVSTLNTDGSAINRIVSIDANRCFIFAAVANSSLLDFGQSNSDGIAVVAINRATLELNQTAAVPGDNGIKAQAFNDNSSQLRIGNPALPNITIHGDTASMFWDDRLQRLYLGVSVTTRTTATTGQGMRSVAVAEVGECPANGTLIINDIAPDSAFDANNNYIVGVVSPAPATSLSLTCTQIAVMHTSTGPSYLIVHGTNSTATNQIYALPLVDLCDPTNPLQGTLADKTNFNAAAHRFQQPALNPGKMTNSNDQFARVGNGPLPIQPDHTISDLQVIDDTVYVSFQIPQDDLNETGILYSQAQFDTDGKIISWTEWTKRAWPICGFPCSPSNGQVAFFAVDAVTGNVIAVDGTPSQTVRITRWDDGYTCEPCAQSCSLAAALNDTFCNGVFSVLDLDQSTTGIGQQIPFRYALFGGTDGVAFALTSSSRAPSAPFDSNLMTNIPYPQNVTLNYCCPETFLCTNLPDNGGCVHTLEYSRRRDALNYFFAGTQNGLYVFADQGGDSFAVTDLGYLTQGIFTSGSWQKIDTIADAVVAIQSSGNSLYVLTFTSSPEVPLSSSLLNIAYTNNIATMFAPGNINVIATSATAPQLDNTLVFTDVEIVQTNANGTTEQLALTTNNGLFQTNTLTGSQNATTQTNAVWSLVGQEQLYYGIGYVDNAAARSTVWPFSADDGCGCNTFEKSSIHQLNGNLVDVTPTFTFIPDFFNYLITACGCCNPADCVHCPTDCCGPNPIPENLYEKIVYFWSDGARRFFILSPVNAHLAPFCCNNTAGCCPRSQLRYLQVTPFNSCVWNNNAPCNWVLKDCILQQQSLYYWVRPIGMTGIILAGTGNGVVALE
jgi:hypothetical protein